MVDKVLHAQMPFTTGRQTINDRLTAAYHSLAGSQLGKTVCKATTEEAIGPKKKHLDYLLHCTNEPNVSIPQLANFLIERTTSANWCTVFKSLITIHNLMCYGNERFSQYLASSNANFNLGNFLDKTTVQGYDMSTHVRRYARYIGEKIFTYRMMAFDFCKVKRGREDGLLRTMPTEKLLKTLPLLQGQIDALLEFQVSSNELTNGVINSCFILLFRDLIRLFACYNDGVINLLEKFFDMNKKQCREALELYKNFLTRMDKVAEFLKVAESVGIDKCEIPDLAKAPSSLIEALEAHLLALEGQKGSGSRVTSPTSGPSLATQSAIQMFSTAGGFSSVDTVALDERVKQKILQEEEQRLNMLKEQRLRELEFSQRKVSLEGSAIGQLNKPKTNPFLTTPVNDAAAKSSSIDDLLSLDLGGTSFGAPAPSVAAPSTNPFQTTFDYHQPAGAQLFGTPPSNGYANGHPATGGFASDDNFARAFGGQQKSHGPDAALGDLLSGVPPIQQQPAGAFPRTTQQQQQPAKQAAMQPGSKFVKGDLDSSLASLAENLNISKAQDGLKNKPVQWGPQRAGSGQQPMYGAAMQQPLGGVYGTPPAQAPYGGGYQPGGWAPQAPGMMAGVPNAQYAAPYGQIPPRPVYGMQQPGAAAPMGGAPMTYGAAPMRPAAPSGGSAQDPFGAL